MNLKKKWVAQHAPPAGLSSAFTFCRLRWWMIAMLALFGITLYSLLMTNLGKRSSPEVEGETLFLLQQAEANTAKHGAKGTSGIAVVPENQEVAASTSNHQRNNKRRSPITRTRSGKSSRGSRSETLTIPPSPPSSSSDRGGNNDEQITLQESRSLAPDSQRSSKEDESHPLLRGSSKGASSVSNSGRNKFLTTGVGSSTSLVDTPMSLPLLSPPAASAALPAAAAAAANSVGSASAFSGAAPSLPDGYRRCCVGEGEREICWIKPPHTRPYRILFHSNQLGLRGTEIGLFEYAKYFEELACGESFIATNYGSPFLETLPKFQARFPNKVFFIPKAPDAPPSRRIVRRRIRPAGGGGGATGGGNIDGGGNLLARSNSGLSYTAIEALKRGSASELGVLRQQQQLSQQQSLPLHAFGGRTREDILQSAGGRAGGGGAVVMRQRPRQLLETAEERLAAIATAQEAVAAAAAAAEAGVNIGELESVVGGVHEDGGVLAPVVALPPGDIPALYGAVHAQPQQQTESNTPAAAVAVPGPPPQPPVAISSYSTTPSNSAGFSTLSRSPVYLNPSLALAPRFSVRPMPSASPTSAPLNMRYDSNNSVLKNLTASLGIDALFSIQPDIFAPIFLRSPGPGVKVLIQGVFSGKGETVADGVAVVGDAVPRKPHVNVVPRIVKFSTEQATSSSSSSPPSGAPPPLQSLREELQIPPNAIAYCRHGDIKTFNILAARDAVCRYARDHPHVYFLFMNTEQMQCTLLPNILHLPASYDELYKRRFLESCNACVHGRSDGETFGMAIAECSLAGKPVFTHRRSGAGNHLLLLKEHAILYNDSQSLYQAFNDFNPKEARIKAPIYKSLYARFSPANVMLDFLVNFGILSDVIAQSTGNSGSIIISSSSGNNKATIL